MFLLDSRIIISHGRIFLSRLIVVRSLSWCKNSFFWFHFFCKTTFHIYVWFSRPRREYRFQKEEKQKMTTPIRLLVYWCDEELCKVQILEILGFCICCIVIERRNKKSMLALLHSRSNLWEKKKKIANF